MWPSSPGIPPQLVLLRLAHLFACAMNAARSRRAAAVSDDLGRLAANPALTDREAWPSIGRISPLFMSARNTSMPSPWYRPRHLEF